MPSVLLLAAVVALVCHTADATQANVRHTAAMIHHVDGKQYDMSRLDERRRMLWQQVVLREEVHVPLTPSIVPSCASSPQADLQGLLAMTAGITTKDPTWTAGTPACQWSGVTCDNVTSTVTEIQWTYLQGTMNFSAIPCAVTVLSIGNTVGECLGSLFIGPQGITGTIDTRSLPRGLQELTVGCQQVSGTLDTRGLPSGLQVLNVQFNLINGTFDLVALPTTLTAISCTHNAVGGTIDFGAHPPPGLIFLAVGGNAFTSIVWGSLSNMVLYNFGISANQLSGTVPWHLVPNSTNVYMGYNQFTGTVDLSQLRMSGGPYGTLSLDNNQFWGSLDFRIVSPAVTTFSAVNNNFRTVVWDGLQNMPSLTWLYLDGNGLQGTVDWDKLRNIIRLTLSNNSLEGTLGAGSWCVFNVSRNAFHGTVPWGSFSNCHQIFDFSHNMFSGTVDWHAPMMLGTYLFTLVLDSNQFYGTVQLPPAFNATGSSGLTLSIANNNFTGSPDLNTPSLQYLDVSGNDFCGVLHVYEWVCLAEQFTYTAACTGAVTPQVNCWGGTDIAVTCPGCPI